MPSKTNEQQTSRQKRGELKASETFTSPIPSPSAFERELVVMTQPEAGLRAVNGSVASISGADTSALASMISSEGITLRPLFGLTEDRLLQKATAIANTTGDEPIDLSVFYRVAAPDLRLEEIADRLRDNELVEAAFIKPAAEPPQFLQTRTASTAPPPPSTADFINRQGYLDAAPGGIDARFAWTFSGGGGADVKIIDIEGAWRFSHEDLLQNQGGIVGGTPIQDLLWRNHGTAVIGAFSGDRSGFGITGICPDANVRAISVFGSASGWGTAAAIRQAADMLNPGDLMLIELHRPGPRFDFQLRGDQRGYIPIEWWPDDMAAISYAVSRGVIVVEAGGNGGEDLDDGIYDVNPIGGQGPFSAAWRNPFRRNPIDTGAILVGAGAPPPGTHGQDHGPDRSRLTFSNYGSIFDAQGWGREVTSCGGGDLQGGTNEDLWYTDTFNGTSSAAPIVVGSLGCLQGALKAAGKLPLSPTTARALLRSTGSPQEDGPAGPRTQRIGNRPNLREMINSQVSTPPKSADAPHQLETVVLKANHTPRPVVINISGNVIVNMRED